MSTNLLKSSYFLLMLVKIELNSPWKLLSLVFYVKKAREPGYSYASGKNACLPTRNQENVDLKNCFCRKLVDQTRRL